MWSIGVLVLWEPLLAVHVGRAKIMSGELAALRTWLCLRDQNKCWYFVALRASAVLRIDVMILFGPGRLLYS